MKAVIYARYSSDNQREESIEGQLRECKEYADKNGITILCSYIDRALSAKTDNRPEFQKMVQDSAKGLFDTVLVWKLDRFARNRYDSAHYKAVLRRNGVKVVSATENISDGPEGIILESMLEGMAEYYSAELAQKINRDLTENALKGKNNGGGIPLGYQLTDDQHLRIDPLTAPIVREIYQRYAEGETVRSIITSLNERHILTQKQKPSRPNSLHSVLCNRKYIGEYRYKDIIIPDGVPSIIPKDLFERVQMRVEKNKRTPARAKAEEEYLLTTKLFCGHCGRMMIGESGKSHTGAIYRYYKCSGAKRKLGCRKKAVKKDWIECIAVQYTIQRVFQDELIAQIADKLVELQNTEDNTLPLLRKQLADTNRGIENMLNAIQQGILTNSTKERLEELEKLREDLKASILQAELEKPKYSREDIIEWISRFKYGDPSNKEYQRQIIDIFLNSIYVFDDRLVFTYNYKNGTQTVSLADVSAAFGSDLKSCTPPDHNKRKAPTAYAVGAFRSSAHPRSAAGKLRMDFFLRTRYTDRKRRREGCRYGTLDFAGRSLDPLFYRRAAAGAPDAGEASGAGRALHPCAGAGKRGAGPVPGGDAARGPVPGNEPPKGRSVRALWLVVCAGVSRARVRAGRARVSPPGRGRLPGGILPQRRADRRV